MQLLFLQQWFSDEVLKAIGWTLIHSLWQGLLAAVVAGVVIITTRRSVARLRYNLLGVVLILFIITSVITFTRELRTVADTRNGFTETGIQLTANSFDAVNYETTSPVALTALEKFVSYFNANADLFVLIWAIFFFVHCIKLVGGLAGIQRMKNYKTHSSPHEWLEKLDHLRGLIGIKKPVILLQSQLVKVPVAIGFFKPVILVPLGLLSNLPPEQVETILLHELAHIRRSDYLVNIFQRFSEAIFFFNPALLWISSLMRQEREACCDDVVIANTNSKGKYLEALVSFQEYSLASQGYAMAISTKRHYLLNRVRRMITRENKKLNSMEKALLITGLVAISAFTFIPKQETNNKKKEPSPSNISVQTATEAKPAAVTTFSKPAPAPKRVSKQQNKKPVLDAPVVPQPRDTVPGAKGKERNVDDATNFHSVSSFVNDDGKTKTEKYTVTDQGGKEYTYTKVNDKLTSLIIGGKIIPENEFSNYAQLLGQIDAAVQQHRAERLKLLEARKANRAIKAEEMKSKLAEKKLLRDYQTVQNQRLLELNKQSRLIDKSRRISESKRKETIRLLNKLKQRRMNVPTLNGREIIKKDVQLDNSNTAVIQVKQDVTPVNAVALTRKVQNNKPRNVSLKVDKRTEITKNIEYENSVEKELLNQYEYTKPHTVKPLFRTKAGSAMKSPTGISPAKLKKNSLFVKRTVTI